MRRHACIGLVAAGLASTACGDDPGPSEPGPFDAGSNVDLSGIRGITVWGASDQNSLFVGDIDPGEPNGIAPDPDDPFATGITEIALAQPVAQSSPDLYRRTVAAVQGAAWLIPQDRSSVLRVQRSDTSTRAVTMPAEVRALDGDDAGLYVATTDLFNQQNLLLSLASEDGQERARLDLGWDNNGGGPVRLVSADAEYVIVSHQNSPSPVHVIDRASFTETATLGPIDGIVRSVSVDDGRVYVVTAGELAVDPQRLDIFDAVSGEATDEGIELPRQRPIFRGGLVALGSGFTNVDRSTLIGRTDALDGLVPIGLDTSVTALERVGDLGVLLVRGSTFVFDADSLEIVFESELFGGVGDLYLP